MIGFWKYDTTLRDHLHFKFNSCDEVRQMQKCLISLFCQEVAAKSMQRAILLKPMQREILLKPMQSAIWLKPMQSEIWLKPIERENWNLSKEQFDCFILKYISIYWFLWMIELVKPLGMKPYNPPTWLIIINWPWVSEENFISYDTNLICYCSLHFVFMKLVNDACFQIDSKIDLILF